VSDVWPPKHAWRFAFALLWAGSVARAAAPDGPQAPAVVISEFMASNARTLADADGDFSDWIELQNLGTEATNLDGWFLTDDASLLRKWRLPAVRVSGGGLVLVFASGKDRAVAGQELHTSFRLDADGATSRWSNRMA